MNLNELLNTQECKYLDFKRQWHKDNADLILDILCMANSDAKTDRYLVIGYDEQEQKIHGDISQNRKSNDDLCNLIMTSHFNRFPEIHIETFKESGKIIDVIVVKKTTHRPYFLLQDKKYKEGKDILRAGVVYTRNGSVNTPKNSVASENQIADMWRERFGLTLSPKERIEKYVQDVEGWEEQYNEQEQTSTFYYKQFPEFTIEYSHPQNMTEYTLNHHAGVVFAHSYSNSYETTLKYKYHTTTLKSESLYICEKLRYYILFPKVDWLYYNPDNYSDIHVFVGDADISHRGVDREEIDWNAGLGGCYKQVTFFYNIKGSFEYYVQQILNKKSGYNMYRDYRFNYRNCNNYDENKDISCPVQIYLIDKDEDIANRLSQEFLKLQSRNIIADNA